MTNAFLRPMPLAPIGKPVMSACDVEPGKHYGILEAGAAGHYWYKHVIAHSVTARTIRWIDPTVVRRSAAPPKEPDGSTWFASFDPDAPPRIVEWNDELFRFSRLVRASSDAIGAWYRMSGCTPILPGHILTDQAIELIRLGAPGVALLRAHISDACPPDPGERCA